ncbi:uncharacterized protein I303_102378 [Kwoniella dejecticola CBS 10117]|uniref:Autophagy-related protein n=1 Tax=Kwoniella dejecticola CBS 10117 TaxID=1296121 RepID=A0A1A6AB53_9TREE|nr:uncharacterized protein I303_01482 [Kwoniella dejecticola CBS 10117]OBR87280.1 hypothetical protein I303_01482 [Kwoniella dejecticola CBS 10117]
MSSLKSDSERQDGVKDIAPPDPATVIAIINNLNRVDAEDPVRGDQVSRKQLRVYGWAFSATCYGIAYLSVGNHPGEPGGSGCASLDLPCRVPFGSGDVNLTSLFLFLNAISFGVSGALTLLICGWGDYLPFKREQYILFTVLYGALALPIAGLTEYTKTDFNTLIGLYCSFAIIGFIAGAWMNIFVPYTMQIAAPTPAPTDITPTDATSGTGMGTRMTPEEELDSIREIREKEGVKISAMGNNALNIGTTIFYLITIGLAYASAQTSLYAGLYMSTAAGGICMLLALAAWRFLPVPPDYKHKKEGIKWWKLPLQTFVELWQGIWTYPEAFKFLLAWTIYNDSLFAFAVVTGNLFNLQIRPTLVEYTAYSITGTASAIIGSTTFYFLFPRLKYTLRQWSIVAYSIPCVVCLWCMFGLNGDSPIGFKHRIEFYIAQVLLNICTAILAPLFRVLFPELFPTGDEIKYFEFQLVLSLGTVWIPQVVDGPIVDRTNNQRLPSIVAFVFFVVAAVLAWWTDDKKGSKAALIAERRVNP